MKKRTLNVILIFFILLLSTFSHAHTINYEVQQKGISVRIFYSSNEPASYSEYEIFGPHDELPYQTGRTDRKGFVSFLPDRPGLWKVKVIGESAHGFHGVTVEVKVDSALNLESFKKPLVATYTKLITGISIIIGLFGIYSLIIARKRLKPHGGLNKNPSGGIE